MSVEELALKAQLYKAQQRIDDLVRALAYAEANTIERLPGLWDMLWRNLEGPTFGSELSRAALDALDANRAATASGTQESAPMGSGMDIIKHGGAKA